MTNLEATQIEARQTVSNMTEAAKRFFVSLIEQALSAKTSKALEYYRLDLFTIFGAEYLIGESYNKSEVGGYLKALLDENAIERDADDKTAFWVTENGIEIAIILLQEQGK
jgi:hypothetical protein